MSLGEKKSESFTENVGAIQGEPDDFVLLREQNRKGAERRFVHKLDMRLMPTVVVIYLMNYIDVSLFIVTVWRRCSRIEYFLGCVACGYHCR
ncbi:hypothetical protein J3R82DRAFT_1488 [Butyriboletus roseoflavus]|nr:hypothetical protein J3R82DRAFT_1488 [Butyriboletus roseoflavus]